MSGTISFSTFVKISKIQKIRTLKIKYLDILNPHSKCILFNPCLLSLVLDYYPINFKKLTPPIEFPKSLKYLEIEYNVADPKNLICKLKDTQIEELGTIKLKTERDVQNLRIYNDLKHLKLLKVLYLNDRVKQLFSIDNLNFVVNRIPIDRFDLHTIVDLYLNRSNSYKASWEMYTRQSYIMFAILKDKTKKGLLNITIDQTLPLSEKLSSYMFENTNLFSNIQSLTVFKLAPEHYYTLANSLKVFKRLIEFSISCCQLELH